MYLAFSELLFSAVSDSFYICFFVLQELPAVANADEYFEAHHDCSTVFMIDWPCARRMSTSRNQSDQYSPFIEHDRLQKKPSDQTCKLT